MSDEGLLLVGHGSRSAQSAAETERVAELVRAALPGVAVEVGYLEMTDPPAGEVLDRFVRDGTSHVVVMPLMLLGAGHAKSDVAAIVLEGRERHGPAADIVLGGPLGLTHGLVAMLGDAVLAGGGGGLPLIVIARGTSDPDANGDACKVARLIGEWTGAPFVHAAFSGVTAPRVPDALDTFARLGHRRIAAAFWFLCHGILVDRARADIAAFSAGTGIEVVDAGYLGPDERVATAALARYEEAAGGTRQPARNCELCAYRAPWPGKEARVGQPAGIGHSHLAIEHRHQD